MRGWVYPSERASPELESDSLFLGAMSADLQELVIDGE